MGDYYLLDHPPASPQFRPSRRAAISGLVVPHTAEGGPAANVARFISTRDNAGSYHELTDPTGYISLMPDSYEAFHVGADRHNWHAWGISAAWRAADWDVEDPKTVAMIATMGARTRAFADRNHFDPGTARWVTREQALKIRDAAIGGMRSSFLALCAHGTLQPGDRSDAWVKHPQRGQLDQMYLEAIVLTPTPPSEPDKKVRVMDIWTTTLPASHPDLAGCGVEYAIAHGDVVVRWQTAVGGDWTPEMVPLPDVTGELPAGVDSIIGRIAAGGEIVLTVWNSQSVNEKFTAWQVAAGGQYAGWLQV